MIVGASSSPIKSVQRGYATIGSGSYVDVTIASVDMAKSICRFNGVTTGDVTRVTGGYAAGSARLETSTTVRLAAAAPNGYVSFLWEVVEYV